MTLSKWGQTPDNVTRLREIMLTPFFQDLVGVLHNNQPLSFPLEREVITDIQANIQLGRIIGYRECLDTLNAMTVYPNTIEDIEADYGVKEGKI